MYQRKVDLDMSNAVKIKLADVSSISPLSEQTLEQLYTLRVQPPDCPP